METIYLNEKKIKRKKLIFKLKIYGSFIVFPFLAVGIIYLIIYSSFFQIKKIVVANIDGDNGLKSTDSESLIKNLKISAASQSKLASILGPDNILIWRDGLFDQSVKFSQYFALISDLTIEKDYLKKEVKIRIQEREKFGIWCSQSECWWFDKEGVIFEPAPKTEGEIIYKINDFSTRKLAIGNQVLGKNLFNNLIKIFEVLEKADLNAKTLRLDDAGLQEVVVDYAGGFGVKIYFSLRTNPFSNLTALKNLKNAGLKKIEYIDLRVENRVFYKLK